MAVAPFPSLPDWIDSRGREHFASALTNVMGGDSEKSENLLQLFKDSLEMVLHDVQEWLKQEDSSTMVVEVKPSLVDVKESLMEDSKALKEQRQTKSDDVFEDQDNLAADEALNDVAELAASDLDETEEDSPKPKKLLKKDSKVECEVCGRKVTKGELDDHVREFHYEMDDPLKCSCCMRVFKDKRNLRYHCIRQVAIRNQTSNTNVCSFCGKLCYSSQTLREHENLVHRGIRPRPHVCDQCGKSYRRKWMLRHHVAVEHEGQFPFQCPQCPDKFKIQQSLKSHMNRCHLGIKPHVCKICGEGFTSGQNLGKHRKKHVNAELGDNLVECAVCGRSVLKGSLQEHMNDAHDPHADYGCPQCAKVFSFKSTLRNHVRRYHRNVGKFLCSFCGKDCRTASLKVQHENVHKGVKPHICDQCGKGFAVRPKLLEHITMDHEGNKLFKCSECPQEYRSRSSLIGHLNQHRGLKPHTCDVCGESFSSSHTLGNHRIAKHKTWVRKTPARAPELS
ncbi:unnamed protein product [Cyprideis torosa]|uniref:Uncharacterized protein n=1 Tax=Cyprideis torosa TaxID=163714 RepID=A0A7R8ZNA3_9CRUS|nr:unnamed protein product [Cyprideis torosa]CAG0887424.1 unnamed protein product [Cyprideis torosa]